MLVGAYYSKNPVDLDVHHVHDDCPAGRAIPAHHLRLGTAAWPLCTRCAER